MVEQFIDILHAIAVNTLHTPVAPKERFAKVIPILVVTGRLLADSSIDILLVIGSWQGGVAPSLGYPIVSLILICGGNPSASAMNLTTSGISRLGDVVGERIGSQTDIDELLVAGILSGTSIVTTDAYRITPCIVGHSTISRDVLHGLRHPQIVLTCARRTVGRSETPVSQRTISRFWCRP